MSGSDWRQNMYTKLKRMWKFSLTETEMSFLDKIFATGYIGSCQLLGQPVVEYFRFSAGKH